MESLEITATFKYFLTCDFEPTNRINNDNLNLGDQYFAFHLIFLFVLTTVDETLEFFTIEDKLNTIPRPEYLAQSETITHYFLTSKMGLPGEIVQSFAPQVSFIIVSDIAKSPLFAGSRMLNLHLQIVATCLYCSIGDVKIERAIRESAVEAVLRTVPVSKSAIYEALTKVDAAATTTTEESCMICLENLTSFYDNEKAVEVVGMPFFHVYHKNCIIRWLERRHICPFCRYAFPTYC